MKAWLITLAVLWLAFAYADSHSGTMSQGAFFENGCASGLLAIALAATLICGGAFMAYNTKDDAR
jgi:hypothetical protein